MSNELEHAIGPMGWRIPSLPENRYGDFENQWYDKAAEEMPICYRSRPSNELLPTIKKKWEDAMSLKGMQAGSVCLFTLEEVVFGRQFDWLPQDIGSCVVSNMLRPWVQRNLVQICGRGDAEEFLGKEEFTPDSISFYGPQSYGMARKRANMRGETENDDGLTCGAIISSLMGDGILDCNTPKLLELTAKLKADKPKMYPEPIGRPDVYRGFGNWRYIEDLRQFCDHRLLASVKQTSVDMVVESLKQYKPSIICSFTAIKKIGVHKDGFDIHARDPNRTWPHNMAFSGFFISSDGKIFIKVNNKSWGPKAVYNVPIEDVAGWFRRNGTSCMSLEEIDLPDSPPIIIL